MEGREAEGPRKRSPRPCREASGGRRARRRPPDEGRCGRGAEVVAVSLRSDPWRAVCPRGHRAWEPTSSGYRCRVCEDTFEELEDAREVLST